MYVKGLLGHSRGVKTAFKERRLCMHREKAGGADKSIFKETATKTKSINQGTVMRGGIRL